MASFSYKASTMDGQIVEGVIEANDESNAIEKLKDTGMIPLKIDVPKTRRKLGELFKPSPKKGLLTFTTELAVMLNAGLPLDRSLSLLSEISESKGMKQVIVDILKDIRGGSSFSDALAKHKTIFPRLYVNMIKAGEAGGVIESILEKLAEFLETSNELKDHVLSAIIYPVILLLSGAGTIIFLLTYVLPQFSVLFQDQKQALPLPTAVLLFISKLLTSYWWVLILVVVGLWLTFKLYIATPAGRYQWDSFKLAFTFDILRKVEIARFCRTLGTLLKSGVTFIHALRNVKDIVENSVIATAIDRVAKGAKEGEGIAQPIAATGVFPPLAVSMIKIGEESGQLDNMLLKVADTYERNLKVALKKFIGLIEPVLILTMGLVIGLIVMAILLAVFSIYDLPF
jgi:general secretion pathway protein F